MLPPGRAGHHGFALKDTYCFFVSVALSERLCETTRLPGSRDFELPSLLIGESPVLARARTDSPMGLSVSDTYQPKSFQLAISP
jgi:hypothetical protein